MVCILSTIYEFLHYGFTCDNKLLHKTWLLKCKRDMHEALLNGDVMCRKGKRVAFVYSDICLSTDNTFDSVNYSSDMGCTHIVRTKIANPLLVRGLIKV